MSNHRPLLFRFSFTFHICIAQKLSETFLKIIWKDRDDRVDNDKIPIHSLFAETLQFIRKCCDVSVPNRTYAGAREDMKTCGPN